VVFISLYVFALLDSDGSGTLNKNEVFMGVEQYCEAREIGFDSRVISRLWRQVDENGDGVFDHHEFPVFLARYCEAVGVGLDDLAFVVLEQLAEAATMATITLNEEPEEPDSVWAKITSLRRKKPKKRSNWAELKVESEEIIDATSLGGWNALKVHSAFNKFRHARFEDSMNKQEAAANVWEKLDHAMIAKKKRLEKALDFNIVLKKKDDPAPEIKKRREKTTRPMSKIQVTSLDGLFCSAGEITKQKKLDRMML